MFRVEYDNMALTLCRTAAIYTFIQHDTLAHGAWTK